LEASLKILFVEKILILVSGSWSVWVEGTPFWEVECRVIEQDLTSYDVAILVDTSSRFRVWTTDKFRSSAL
jgi:hypothetical protein